MRLARLSFVPVLGLLPLLGLGCSGAEPPTPRGAYTMNFADPGIDCSAPGHLAILGEVSSAQKVRLVTDGEDDSSVDCSVSGSGTFSVSAVAKNPAEASEIHIKIDAISPAATRDAPATGSISFSSARTGGQTFYSDPATPCNFWFEGKQGVDAGKIWVGFECPAMLNEGEICQLRLGVLAFDSCGG
ncbi:hypothetical protein WME79_34145 [Sorangium sp. So ce726]|uniref:hypothetical protein n=1 Tax=Sorangium sp. So ce726 TaxID=3133319 RepID=UPI003F644F6A